MKGKNNKIVKKSPFVPRRGEGKPVRPLSENVFRKIAAGEVIDRPNAILRELVDNAIDSGARRIVAEIENGGIDSIRVVDNGCGMTKEDLENCSYPHATSKINSETDLDNLATLGFRGEALASIAAVSRLSIQTARKNSNSWKMEVSIGKKHIITPANLDQGTIIQAQGLFENFPARRQFLKRPGTESNMCRQTFIEKAIPVPEIAFRLVVDNKIRLDLPAGQTLIARFLAAIGSSRNEQLFSKIHAFDTENREPQWKITIVLGSPAISRTDKKQMFVYVNGRRVHEYSMLQAIDYGAQGYFPNGTHPIAALFIEMASNLVDFNIHPAKKEVRFKNSAPVHHAVSTTVRSFYRANTISDLAKESSQYKNTNLFGPPTHPQISDQNLEQKDSESRIYQNITSGYKRFASCFTENNIQESNNAVLKYEKKPLDYPNTKTTTSWRYIGHALGVFLIVEKENNLLLIDQHAGHERIRYNDFMQTAGQKQKLLIPFTIKTAEKDDDLYLEKLVPELSKAGFEIQNCGGGHWEISSIPIKWEGTEEDLQQDLLEKRLSPHEVIQSIAAITACRGAIKDGDNIDSQTAEKFLEKIFALPEPRCPHGRPIWTVISKEELFKRVKR